MHHLRPAGASRACSRPDASAPPPRISFLRITLDWLFGRIEDGGHFVLPDDYVRAMTRSPRWVADCYLDDPRPEEVTDDLTTWPSWTYLPVGLRIADGVIQCDPDHGLDLDRFSVCCGTLQPRPTIAIDRAEGGDL